MSPPSRSRKRTSRVIATIQGNNSTVNTRRREEKRDFQKITTTLAKAKEKEVLERVLAAAEVVMPAIKLEAFEPDERNSDKQKSNNKDIPVNIDVKPDVNLLEQHMLLQQIPTTAQLQQQFVRVLVANPNNMVLANDAPNLTSDVLSPVTLVATPTTTPVLPVALANMSEFTVMDDFEKDDIDLQTSDSDEEGYSDLDLEEDDEFFEDNDETDVYDPVWHDQPTAKRMVFNFKLPLSEVGMVGRPKTIDTIFYFDAMLGNRADFFNYLALSCNERAQQMLQQNSVGQMYLQQITAEEMQIFFAICLEMCNIKLPNISDYWSSKSVTGFRGFGAYMTLKRFHVLLRALNFSQFPLATHSKQSLEALADLRPLLEFFNQRMIALYRCGQRLVLNEPVVYWKGRMHWLHNLSDKFRSNALILHFLKENTGLLLRVVPEIERTCNKVQRVKNSRCLVNQRITIAKSLLHDNLNSGRVVFVPKYYNSYGLIYELARETTYCTGFLDQKRYGNSKQLVLKKLAGNAHATKYACSIMMGKRRRKAKYVYFASSDCLAIYAMEAYNHPGDTRLKIIKELDWQLNTPKNISEAMIHYQLALEQQQLKWDRTVMIYIFNLMVLNAYILYTTYAQFGRARITELHLKDISKLKTIAEFRQDIVQSLLQAKLVLETDMNGLDELKHIEPKITNLDLAAPIVVGGTPKLKYAKHILTTIPRSSDKTMKKRCRICRKGGLLTLTKFCCVNCPSMPGLCETPCFQIWHDQQMRAQEASEHIKQTGN